MISPSKHRLTEFAPTPESTRFTPKSPRTISGGGSQTCFAHRKSSGQSPRPSVAVKSKQRPKVSSSNGCGILFQSKEMTRFVNLAKRYAASSASVLITGESGTGKELFSKLIHENSPRQKQNLVAVNCAAVSESLFESELFGHEKGAFTGACSRRIGYFEFADKGTLLLDEVTEIPLSIQAKLLRVLEERQVQRVGSSETRSIDVRILATSNRNLEEEVKAGRFRTDLYHRINTLELNIPSLRERVVDIPLLTHHFLRFFAYESETGMLNIDKQAMEALCRFDWPGNVRQLRNVIHRACVVASSGSIAVDDLPESITAESATQPVHLDGRKPMTLAEIEKRIITATLAKFDGSKKLASAELGVTARTLSNKLRQYQQLTEDC